MKYTRIAKLADRIQRRRAKRGQAGFTLLELLVVVAILAAIAGTAAIALQDTDARASAAAHVAMMDELNKGIHTYRVLNKNEFPNNFDSMLGWAGTGWTDSYDASQDVSGATFPENELIGIEDVGTLALTADAAGILADIGITQLQYLNYGAAVDLNEDLDTNDCASANIVDTIRTRSNAVVGGNIFMTPNANGCGAPVTLHNGAQVLVWTGGYERLLGSAGLAFDQAGAPDFASGGDPGDAIATTAANTPVFMIVGIGPSSTLFNTNALGGMTTVPVYRHVKEDQYQRFAAVFNIGSFTDTSGGYSAADQVTLVGIIDGAGDTKEEELGEWDGTRNTI